MKKTISIENLQVKTKLNNFIKTCETLLSRQKDPDQTLQAKNAFKVLLRFLKNDSALNDIYLQFDAMESITKAYALAQKIAAQDFTVSIEDKSAETQSVPEKHYQIGDVVEFGKKTVRETEQALTWKVISVKDDKILLFAEKSYLWEPFDVDGSSDWQASSLRKKLNTDWFNETFSDAEKACITTQGNADPIFIPSLENLLALIPEHADRCDSKAAWWTSSPKETDGILESFQRDGEVQPEGTLATKKQGVRPAFWIASAVVETALPQDTDQQEEEAPRTLPCMKVLCVEDGEDYYIAFATPQDEISSLFLRKASSESAHFQTSEELQKAVETFRSINERKYQIEIVSIDMTEFMNQEYEAAHKKHIIEDQEGYPVICIDAKGKKTFPMREEDVAYRLVDKMKYQPVMEQLIAKETDWLSDELDYYHIGKAHGYEVALDCDAPHVRYEIFKARDVIESYHQIPELEELHAEDEKYYLGYIDAMMDALTVQSECVFQECQWAIDIVDLRTKIFLTKKQESSGHIPELGQYFVRIHNEIPTLDFNDDCRHIVIALVHQKIDWVCRDTELALQLPPNVALVFADEKTPANKLAVSRIVKTALNGQCKLGEGLSDYRLPVKMISALSDFREMINDETEDKKDAVSKDSHEPTNQIRALDLRFESDKDILFDYKYKDDKILQSIKLPLKMETLPEGLFYNCRSLEYVTLPKNLRVLSQSVFEGCVSLWRVYLPETLTRIESRAFYACRDLEKIFLPPNLEYIGSDAFCGCVKLLKIYLPANIQYIANDAFDECFSLNRIDVPIGFHVPESLSSKVKVVYYSNSEKRPQPKAIDPEDFDKDIRTEDTVFEEELEKVFASDEIPDENPCEPQSDPMSEADFAPMVVPEKETVTAEELLNHTLRLLDQTSEPPSVALSSVIQLLSKEYENDQT